MRGAVKTAVWSMIFKSTTCVPAAGWELMPRRISLRYAQLVIELGIFIAKHKR